MFPADVYLGETMGNPMARVQTLGPLVMNYGEI